MATEILKKQTIVGTDAQYEAHKDSYEEGTVFESTSPIGENDIDPEYTNKFVPTRKVTDGLYLYAYDKTGNISQSADTGINPYTVARRGEGGTLNVGDPTGQYNAVNKGFADANYVERKVSESGLYAYCFDTTGITKTRYISEGFPAFSLVERDEKGRVRTADPEGQNDAANKKYVDDGFVAKKTTTSGVYLYAYDSTGDISQAVDTVPTEGSNNLITSGAVYSAIVQTLNTEV